MSQINFAELDRIDVHSHAITPKYREYLLQTGHDHPDGWPYIPVRQDAFRHAWSVLLTITRSGARSNTLQ